jgi:hypothetical protein
MWNPATRHSRDHLRYGSDLTDAEWEIIVRRRYPRETLRANVPQRLRHLNGRGRSTTIAATTAAARALEEQCEILNAYRPRFSRQEVLTNPALA